MPDPRWLPPDDAAAYIGVKVHHLPRLVKAGKLPAPSCHLGPRSPRWDREELDRLFGVAARSSGMDKAVNDAVQQILAEGRARRAKAAQRRHGAGVSIPAPSAKVAVFAR